MTNSPESALSHAEAGPNLKRVSGGSPEPLALPLDRAAPDDAPPRGSLFTLRQKADIAERVWPGTKDAPMWVRLIRCVLVHAFLNGIDEHLTVAERLAMAEAVEEK